VTAPLVTCVIPVWNGARFLGEAIRSVLAQTYTPVEIVVVDDGSTDSSSEVARSFGPPVRCIRQENAGPCVARNTGLADARGELIGFLDADDLWDETKLARQWAVLRAHPEAGYCVTHIQNFWTSEVEAEAEQWRDHPRAQPVPGYLTAALLAFRTTFDRIGSFDPTRKHTDATDWFLRARAEGVPGLLLPDVLVYRRLHRENRSRVKADGSRDEFLSLLKDSLDRRRGVPGRSRHGAKP
jgi:glycosyltransferase involved in cell wall biosynthesis